jgi:FtsH-binding integral membrane protein
MEKNLIDKPFFRGYFSILKYISIMGLYLFLIQSFYNKNIEPAFWVMGISTALAGLLATKSNKELSKISQKFLFSTVNLIIAISIGGIFVLFGGGIGLYQITSNSVFVMSVVAFISWGLVGVVGVGTFLGITEFIEGIYELFKIQNSKQ